jgi:hypothetical protein
MELNKQHQIDATPTRADREESTRFDALPNLVRQHLQDLADSVVGVVSEEQNSWIIHTSELGAKSNIPGVVEEVRRWAGKGSKFLYYLQLLGQPDLDAIRKAYSSSRKRDKGTRAYARLIKNQPFSPNRGEEPLTCFYVGSSSNVSLRLKEHLGYGAKATFSLQLAHWTEGLDLELKFICAKYRGFERSEVYQALEDTLWDQLTPIFGRRGGR